VGGVDFVKRKPTTVKTRESGIQQDFDLQDRRRPHVGLRSDKRHHFNLEIRFDGFKQNHILSSDERSTDKRRLYYIRNKATMKFVALACILASSGVSAFSPVAFAARRSTVVYSAATDSKTYTFTKSEEIFKEAQEVGFDDDDVDGIRSSEDLCRRKG
jgi:hypothetical protein